jgi:HSP20 family protein
MTEAAMNLIKWDPYRELEEMSSRLNRFFGRTDVLARAPEEKMTPAVWAPAVDIKETPEEYVIKAEIPEVKKEEVKVLIKDGLLTLSGERHIEKEEKTKKFHRVERAYGAFTRSFELPTDVDDKKVSADFKDGMLLVHLPKSEQAKPKSVEVKIS